MLHWHLFATQIQPSGALHSSPFVSTEGWYYLIVSGLLPFNTEWRGLSWQNFTHSWSLMTSWFCYLFTSSKSTWLLSWFDLFTCSLLHHWRGRLPRRQNSRQTWALCSQWILVVMGDLPAFVIGIFKAVVILFCWPGKMEQGLWHLKRIFIAMLLVYFTQRSFYICKLVICWGYTWILIGFLAYTEDKNILDTCLWWWL